MPQVTSHTPGTFCWVELATSNPESAKTFYSQLLGWTWSDEPVSDEMLYTILQRDGNFVGGLFQMHTQMVEQGIPPHWACYISTDDVEAASARIAEAGGAVISGPFDVFELGRMLLAADPTGATFAVWQPNQHIGAQLIHEVGSLGWTELSTTDVEAAFSFYSSVFGWTRNIHPVGPENQEYHEFQLNDEGVAGMMQIQPEWGEVPPNWTVYFRVSDVDASLQQAQELGASVIVPVMAEGGVRFALLTDLQGVHFGIVQVSG